MNDKSIKIVQSLIRKNLNTAEQLSRAKRQLARDFNIGIVSNNWLLQTYRECLSINQIKANPRLENLLIKRPVRTLSGIAPVTVAAKPYPCPGRCIYCPSNALMPKSYLPSQPAAARALRFKYSPFRQVQGRLLAFYNNGHQPEKVELRILGGTWSAYPRKYQNWFVRELYRGLNEFKLNSKLKTQPRKLSGSKPQLKTKNLESLQKINETAQHRCVGLSIETRPDWVNLDEMKRLREFGVTKVELGVQHLDQKVLDLIKRDQTKDDVVRATKLLKDAGFKICYHIMPNLPGSTAKLDLQMFKELFDDPKLRPDQLKIYPCAVLKNARLYHWWKQGKYKTYDDKILIDLLAQMKKFVPPYVRIERIYRDVPSCDIVAGCRHINIREMAQAQMNYTCKCIRCMEVKDKLKSQNLKLKTSPRKLSGQATQNSKLFVNQYDASGGIEYFMSFENPDRKILYAFIRLRFPSDDFKNQLLILQNTAIIRELHTYGPLVPINSQFTIRNSQCTQHKGLGKRLLHQAEKIAKSAGYDKIAVISGVGVREYYRKLGYKLEEKWGYMIKNIKKILIIIAPQGFQDQEYSDTRREIESAGAQIIVGSLKLGKALGNFGSKARIDILAQDASPNNFDAVVFIGGQGMVELVNKNELTNLAYRFYNADKITAAICIAPMILAHAGILKGKKATVWPNAKGELIEFGADYTGKPVEVDGKIITANGPDAASAFGKAIAKMLT